MDQGDIRYYGSSTVGARGQVAIPAPLRRKLGLKTGDQVLFVQQGEEKAGFQVCLPSYALQGRLPAPIATPHAPRPPEAEAGPAPSDSVLAAVRSLDLFRDLDPAFQRQIAGLLREGRYARGEVIVREGEPCEALYCVASGLVKRYKLGPTGKEQVLKVLGPGDSFNEVPVLDGGPNPAWAEALEESVVYALHRQDFLVLLERNPDMCRGLVQVLGGRLRHLVGVVEDLSLRQVTGRVARLLLQQAEVAGRLTQQEMAAMVGTVREVIGRALHDLEELGAIRIRRGRIVILNPDLLREFV